MAIYPTMNFWVPLMILLSVCTGQLIDETTTTVPNIGTDLIPTTLEQPLETTTTTLETTTGFPDEEMPTFPSLGSGGEDENYADRIVPFGVVLDEEQVVVKKRCRCIEKKRRKVVKEIKYIPLNPSIQLAQLGRQRNFTCKCSHLRKLDRKP